MGKRKQIVKEKGENNGDDSDKESSGEEDFDLLDVEFEWFDPQPKVDFHGSTVKVDGNETDAYAFLSVINLQEHKDIPVVMKITQYLKTKASKSSNMAQLQDLFSQLSVQPVGLILTERLINVPSEVVPPMHTMLLEEIDWALEENEPYNFSHYLILSKTYTETESNLDVEDDRPRKKKKSVSGFFEQMYFHPEDEIFQRHAICHGGFDYSTKHDEGHSDSKRAFNELGIKPQGRLILIDAHKFKPAVQEVAEHISPPS